jgi:osmotically-inducible protein OsmY
VSEEIPERIEREMFEIRSRMAPDVTDLRKHVEPQVVAEQVKQTLRQRLQDAVDRLKANLKAKQQEFVDSAKRQLNLAREAGEKRDPTPLTEAVKSDPRPLALLAVLLVVTLLTVRKMSGSRGEE